MSGLNLTATTHSAPGAYLDNWSFTSPSGNYNNAAGTVASSISFAPAGNCLGSLGRTILQPIDADGSSVFKQADADPRSYGSATQAGIRSEYQALSWPSDS